MGIGETRLQAKTATGFAKPGGVARLTRADLAADHGAEPVTAIWGIGERTARPPGRGRASTRCTIWPGPTTRTWPGGSGPASARPCGCSAWVATTRRSSTSPGCPRSRSKETTYRADLTDPAEVDAEVGRLAREVTASVVAEGRTVTHVHVKVRTATFFTRIKSSKLAEPTTDPEVVAERALVVLDRFEPARRIRLLGVRVMLEPPAG